MMRGQSKQTPGGEAAAMQMFDLQNGQTKRLTWSTGAIYRQNPQPWFVSIIISSAELSSVERTNSGEPTTLIGP